MLILKIKSADDIRSQVSVDKVFFIFFFLNTNLFTLPLRSSEKSSAECRRKKFPHTAA